MTPPEEGPQPRSYEAPVELLAPGHVPSPHVVAVDGEDVVALLGRPLGEGSEPAPIGVRRDHRLDGGEPELG